MSIPKVKPSKENKDLGRAMEGPAFPRKQEQPKEDKK